MSAVMTAQSDSLTQEDALLLIADGATGSYPLDPIRLMKGAFLVTQLGRPHWRELFAFRPYHYGPFDSSVYMARDRLVRAGLLAAERAGRYPRYELTEDGRGRVAELERDAADDADWFRQVGRYVTTRPFAQLLDEIYERYPDFAVRSVMR
jgi:hypothetical protein